MSEKNLPAEISLNDAIEVSYCGQRDEELQAHVTEFLQSVGRTVELCRMNLLTQEDARLAARTLQDLRERVNQHRRTANALRRLLKDGVAPGEAAGSLH